MATKVTGKDGKGPPSAATNLIGELQTTNVGIPPAARPGLLQAAEDRDRGHLILWTGS